MLATNVLGPTPSRPFISATNLQPPPESFLAVINSGHSRRKAHQPSATSQDVGGLGKAVLGALQSGATTTQDPGPQGKKKVNKQKEIEAKNEEKGKEMSGSDILRALQRASAKKAQISSSKKKLQRGTAEPLNRRENMNGVVDYDKIRILTIKSDWASRLDELEKRLQEFLNI